MDIIVKSYRGESVSINRRSLPENPYDIIYMLKMEVASRSCWRDVAGAYFDNGNLSAAITILEQSISDQVEHGNLENKNDSDCSRLHLLASLGGAYLMLADTLLDNPTERQQALEKARSVFSSADKIDVDDPSIWVARGWRDFAIGKINSAKDWFDNAHNKSLVLGSLGLAALLLNKPSIGKESNVAKNDPVALIISALRTNLCPPSAWTALGHALFRDNRLSEAREVARRALHAVSDGPSEERLEALYLIALIEASERTTNGTENMVAALREAYVKCGGHKDTRILSLIADTYFNGGDMNNALAFAQASVERAEESPLASIGGMYSNVSKNTVVQALFQLGRAQQHLMKFDNAMQTFEKIQRIVESPQGAQISVNPGFHFRLGMLKLSTGRKEDEKVAQECLEKVLKNTVERSYPAMRALGFLLGRRYLLAMPKGKPRGGDLYRRAIDLLKSGLADSAGKRDTPAQLMYAALTEESDPEISLSCYEAVVAAAKEAALEEAIATGKIKEEDKNTADVEINLDIEIWINMASIQSRVGKMQEAKEIMEKYVKSDDECPTVWYNRGRLAEIMREEDEAVAHFEKITKDDPHFPEAQVRLGVIAANRGNAEQAESLFKAALENKLTRQVAAAHLANLYGGQTQNRLAQEVLEQHRGDCDYLTLAFSRFIFKWLPSEKADGNRRWRFLKDHIGAPVMSVLKRNKANAYAANAAGLFFTEVKEINNARDAFTAAGTAKSISRAARVNLAHTEVIRGRNLAKNAFDNIGRIAKSGITAAITQFEKAERLYDTVLRTSKPHSSPEAYQEYMELTHYLGSARYEARAFQKAKKTFQKVLRFEPGSWATWYNLSLTLYECARHRILEHSKVLHEMLTAKKEFQQSLKAMKLAAALGRSEKGRDPVVGTRPDQQMYGIWYQYIKQEMKRHEVNIVNARTNEEDRKKKEEEKENQLREMERARLEKEARIVEEERERVMKIQRAAEAAARKLAEIEVLNEQEREQKEAKKNKIKNEDAYDTDDDHPITNNNSNKEDGEENEDMGEARNKKKKRTKENNNKKNKKDGKEAKGDNKGGKRKRKRKLLSDDEMSSDEDGAASGVKKEENREVTTPEKGDEKSPKKAKTEE